ncbi:uncharacterized protein LOC128765081 [Synchiropus splendidus]|uniref:uncharacterized protein LOC128765081 n=1 Tax=Synchiropus splendidus TaxID=270530 RepID=UPI00237E37A3|nr:uncharacterized protein LOC128765081 [Synchiropus splendidus]
MSDEAFVRNGSFTTLWRNFTSVCDNNNNNNTTAGRMRSETRTPDRRKDLQSPQRRDYCKYAGLNYGDSPSDVEPTQDIIWDATSPTHSAKSLRANRVVEVADIVNRIAPTDVKPKGDSPLLQWIGDSAIPCTPEVQKPRSRKKSSRQSSVDLMVLARQFDQNMQQEIHTSEQQNLTNLELVRSCHGRAADGTPTLQCSSASDKTEAELHALFDCSAQCDHLSQGTSTSGYSQEVRKQPVEKSNSESHPAQDGALQNYDDDWENDDILNDSFVLEMTQDPEKHYTKLKDPAHSHLQDSESELSLQELCPKTRTSTRSTFRLQSNPDFQHAVKNQNSTHGPSSAAGRTKSDKQPAAGSDVLDSVWDDDDKLLCQACDSVEQNIQPQQQKPANFKTTPPLPIDRPNTARATPFVRSNSYPETHCDTISFQGWDAPMRGAGPSSTMSQSLPAAQCDATFIQQGCSPGSYRLVDLGGKLHEVTTRPTLNAKPHSFKRNLSDSAVSGNKVFITSQRGECSAAEIEKKKQDAQARRRLRMQNHTKP